ncbi:STAS/SEC14 domain-containing protein [Ilumatobacter sp.]|uniref:STAS/SEC14 domain-containing protein n=1 Tax=Ilumatobacter sp. TaxID=1967498 RepID=UPI003C56660B
MIEVLDGYRDGVLAIDVSGEVSDDDYEDVLDPAIADLLTRHDKIRLLYRLGEDFEGYEGDAMWEDAKLGMRNFTKFDRLAVVTDTTWVRRSVKAFGWMMPGQVRVFGLGEMQSASTWISEAD